MNRPPVIYGPGCRLGLPFVKLSMSYRRPGNEVTEDDFNIFVLASPYMVYWIGVHGSSELRQPVANQQEASVIADCLARTNIVLSKNRFPQWLRTRKVNNGRQRGS